MLLHKDAKDVFVLGGLEEIQAAFDESNIHVSTILSSRNCGPIKSRVEEWAKNLEVFSKTLVNIYIYKLFPMMSALNISVIKKKPELICFLGFRYQGQLYL